MASVYPVLYDRQPAFLRGAEASLLFMPVASGTLFDEITTALRPLTTVQPFVLPTFDTTPEYVGQLAGLCAPDRVLASVDALRHQVALLDPADELLLIDIQRYPAGGYDFRSIFEGREGGYARHVVNMPVPQAGARERAWVTPDGRLRRIQRYFSTEAWPFAAGVLCSAVPATAFMALGDVPLDSLTQLRREMSERGVPSRDIAFSAPTCDLGGEDGALRLVERVALSESRTAHEDRRAGAPRGEDRRVAVQPAPARATHGARAQVAPSARLIGHVVLGSDVQVGEDAIVVGPTVIGSGVQVGARAVIAQCLVLPRTQVPQDAIFRHRVVHKGMTPDNAEGGAWRPHVSRHHASEETERMELLATDRYPEIKRWVEGFVALVALVALSPVMLCVALAIRLTSRGPVFFGHTREGLGGRPFRCWKFRTMGVNADAAWQALRAANQWDGPQFKMASDPRVTPIGRILRAANLDELPQLFNVVRGEMSFVGPRPSPLRENQICVPWRRGRLSVRPGITGLWQICRHDREEGDFHQWIEYDLMYVRNLSPALDLKIFIATILTAGGKWPVSAHRLIPTAPRPTMTPGLTS